MRRAKPACSTSPDGIFRLVVMVVVMTALRNRASLGVLLTLRALERQEDGLFERGGGPAMESRQTLRRAQSLGGGL